MTEHTDLGATDTSTGCACCGTSTSTKGPSAASSVTEDILVSGMTCSHCVSTVTEELTAVDGVDSVTVDLNGRGPSRVTIHSATPVGRIAVKTAIEEAGYALAECPA